MLGETIVSNPRLRIHVAEENSIAHDRLDVNAGVAEVRRSSQCRDCAIDNHCCHPGTVVMRKASAVSIAMLHDEGREDVDVSL